MIKYTINESDVVMIKGHLLACDETYVPRLSERVDLDGYASKLHRLAARYEAWQDDQLIGLVAAYFETAEAPEIFVSNVSVNPAMRAHGIGTALLTKLVADARLRSAGRICLEVSAQNYTAQKFYSKLGFIALTAVGAEPTCMVFPLREKKL